MVRTEIRIKMKTRTISRKFTRIRICDKNWIDTRIKNRIKTRIKTRIKNRIKSRIKSRMKTRIKTRDETLMTTKSSLNIMIF